MRKVCHREGRSSGLAQVPCPIYLDAKGTFLGLHEEQAAARLAKHVCYASMAFSTII